MNKFRGVSFTDEAIVYIGSMGVTNVTDFLSGFLLASANHDMPDEAVLVYDGNNLKLEGVK